ncbi:hypothetical protein CTEN210_06633 [Chaetoceros tenuissimus]|uniref:Leucine-rich repeat domain-containing protein n=1 Tax=Chaetoceros tenuissimus TaxID=426638 RepID=A0AAD3CQ79_9STRA|nr:hypothetical protein CTEN210_06633 [Chaetoceros tenuissimus]
MYKGKRTLFYNGEILVDLMIDEDDGRDDERYLIYDQNERQSWEVIIVLPGVEEIPSDTFFGCENVKTVIMADTVRRIEWRAFAGCERLVFVRLSLTLEFIASSAFQECYSLVSIFIPPSCEEIRDYAFGGCQKLIIFNVPHHTQLGENVIARTALLKVTSFKTNEWGEYFENTEEVNQWIKNINQGEDYELHRACSSFNPLVEAIYGIVKQRGLCSFQKKNQIGLTALDYLVANPYVEKEIDQKLLMKRYVMEMMGEAV